MIIARLKDGAGDEQDRVAADDIDLLRVLIETFLLPGAGPGDVIEIGDPDPISSVSCKA